MHKNAMNKQVYLMDNTVLEDLGFQCDLKPKNPVNIILNTR